MSSARQAFDRHAAVYDRVFSDEKIRSEVWEIADGVFPPGSRILDLGCGTGEDAIHFASRGIEVSAIDVSPEMILRLKNKVSRVRCEVADMESYTPPDLTLDGIFSNFGALNCSGDLGWLGRLARASLTPNSHIVLTTMGRFYPLETFLFCAKLQPRRAFRRFQRPSTAVVEGVRFDVYYHGIAAIREALGNDFELVRVKGLRSLLPVPGLEHLERYESLRLLKPMDRWLCSNRLTSTWADHFISVWRRKGS